MAGRAAPSRVDRAGGERRGRSAGAADAAVGRACRPVVAGRCDHERVERGRARRGGGERAVGERRERLDDTDEGDARRIVGVTVLVGVDRELEPGEKLIGAAVDGDAARGIRLPPRDPDRKQERHRGRRPGGRQARPSRRRGPPSRCRAARACPGAVGFCRALASPPGSSTSSPRISAPRMYGCTRSTPVSSNATVTPAPEKPGMPTSGRRPPAMPRRSSTLPGSTAAGIAARTGNTPFDVRVADGDRERAGIERRREAVEHAVVRVLGLDRRALEREPREHLALRRRARRPSRRAPAPPWRSRLPRRHGSRGTASRARRSSGHRVAPRAGRRAGSPTRPRFPRAGRRRSHPRRAAAQRPRAPPRRRREPAAPSAAAPSALTRPRLGSRRIRIHDSGLGSGQGVGEARRRRDHRRVVGAERERHERRIGQRRAELGVRRHAADDRDALDPGVLAPPRAAAA